MKKIEVHFNKNQYSKDSLQFNKKLSIAQLINDEVRRLSKSDADLKLNFLESPLSSFFDLMAVATPNPMNLSGEKLVELQELDISQLKKLCNEWETVKDLKKPKKSDYTIYAQTKEQINKYNKAKNLIKALNEASEFFYSRAPYRVIQPFHHIIKLDERSNMVVNPSFIVS